MNNIFKIVKLLLSLTLSIVFLSACSNTTLVTDTENSNLKVYTSIFPVSDLVLKIGGDRVDVSSLIKNGEDAHSFEPTAKDIINLENGDILFYNGAGLENWIDKLKTSINNPNLKFINLSEGINLIENEELENHNHNHIHEEDPHIWLSPLNVIVIANNILKTLVASDPENETYYTENYTNLISDLVTLHTTYKTELANLTNNKILVTHNAYGYLCDLYGLNQISISNSIENDEVSPAKLIQIINYIRENNIKYILTDGLSSPKIAESIASETGVEILILSTLESLTEEELLNRDDFFSIMYKNLEVLKIALS